MELSPDYLHGAWAIVAALIGRLYYLLSREVAGLQKSVHSQGERLHELQTHYAVQSQALDTFKEAVDELKGAIRENTRETTAVKEGIIELKAVFRERQNES
jgi:uncharacterized coiled-coil protein SlyX